MQPTLKSSRIVFFTGTLRRFTDADNGVGHVFSHMRGDLTVDGDGAEALAAARQWCEDNDIEDVTLELCPR
jgi:hypothetical protein